MPAAIRFTAIPSTAGSRASAANGVPADRPGHYVYLRDDQTGEYWSISWQPVGKDLQRPDTSAVTACRTPGSRCDYRGLHAEQTVFIPLEDDVELWDVKIRNKDSPAASSASSPTSEFSFHHIEIDNQNLQMSLYAAGARYKDGVIEYDFFYEPWTSHYFTASFEPAGFDCVRDTFLGPYRSETNPGP